VAVRPPCARHSTLPNLKLEETKREVECHTKLYHPVQNWDVEQVASMVEMVAPPEREGE